MKITETEFIVHKAKNKDPDAFLRHILSRLEM